MKKFIALYHAPAEALHEAAKREFTEEQKAEVMKAWGEWNERSGDAIVELGAPLGGGESLNGNNQWAESNKGVSGYSIVQAQDKDGAKALFKNHIHLQWLPGASIEIHEVQPM